MSKAIFTQPGLICSFSKRPFNMSLRHGDTRDTLNNRRIFLAGLGIDSRDLVCAEQVHGANIYYADHRDRGKGALSCNTALAQTDGLVTDKVGVPLAIFTADCLSIFLYEPELRVIALVHAGWRGTKAGILTRALALMQDKFKIPSEDLLAGFGPAIRSCCYEVGEEFREFFDYGLSRMNNRYHLDLIALNRRQLLEAGISENHISDSGICTSCSNQEFFSFRKDGESCARMMSVAMLK